MKNLLLVCLVLISSDLIVSDFSSSDYFPETDNHCVIKYLKDQGLLESDFPSPVEESASCDGVIQKILTKIEKLNFQLDDKEGPFDLNCFNEECITKLMKKDRFIELLMKNEVIRRSTLLPSEQREQKLNESEVFNDNLIKKISETCKTDESFLKRRLCFAEFLIKEGFIKVGDADINPTNLNATELNCENVISNLRERYENDVFWGGSPFYDMDCLLREFRNTKVFEERMGEEMVKELQVINELKKDQIVYVDNEYKYGDFDDESDKCDKKNMST